MSFYNLVFGQNPLSDIILATIGLTRADCGRFRDCFITDGKIAVYTRNGGGNRNCWCEDDPKYGRQACKHHVVTEHVSGATWKDYYICENPSSADCACPGCVIEYRLPKHSCYLRDRDDEFDCTYATIYFKFPDEYAKELAMLDSGEEFKPSQRWLDAIDSLRGE